MPTAGKFARLCLLALFVAMMAFPARGVRGYFKAPIWKNEPLHSSQGVMSLEVRGEGFPRQTPHPLQIVVKHLPTQTLYVVNQPLLVTKERQRSLYWKLPAGRYEVERIARFYNGRAYVAPKDPRFRFFVVESFALTDLGVWAPRLTTRGLGVTFHSRMVQSFFFPKGDDSIDAIIDGFSERRLQAIGGRGHKRRNEMALAAKTAPPVVNDRMRNVRVSYAMYLTRNQQLFQDLMPTIKAREERFRNCYLAGLRFRGNREGSVRFDFILGKDRATPKVLNYRGGTLANRQTIECLYAELNQARFPTRKPASGSVVIDFKAR